MEPIINPWLIYFIGISDNLQQFGEVIGFVFGVLSFGLVLFPFCVQIPKILWGLLFTIPLFIIGVLIGILVPDKQWIIATILANETTPQNIEKVVNSGKSIKDEIKADFIEIINLIEKNKLDK